MRALISGFDPFAGMTVNPSAMLVEALAKEPAVEPFERVDAIVLPTVYARAAPHLIAAIRTLEPDLVMMFGLARRSDTIRLERFALNVADCSDPDNDGVVLAGAPVSSDGPTACATGLDLGAIVERFDVDGVASPRISNYAGTFVCNHVYYSVLQHREASGAVFEGLFVHIPPALPLRNETDVTRSPLAAHVSAARGLLRATGKAMLAGSPVHADRQI